MELVLVHCHQEEAAASTYSSYSKEGFSIPYYATDKYQIHVFSEQKKIRFFTFNKIHHHHSTRHRGSKPFSMTSLARKLGRFKVRSVVAQDPPTDEN